MPIFPNLELEPIVQVNDRTRLDASKSFATQDLGAVTVVEIDPGTGTFINVTPATPTDSAYWFLDYQYAAASTQTVRSRITCGLNPPVIFTKTLSVVTELSDHLFAADSDLSTHEPDILKWVRSGRNTFKDVHRAVQSEIIDWLDEQGFVDALKNKYTKAAIVDVSEVREWSKFMALRMIYEGIQNAEDDVFEAKAKLYGGKESHHRNRAILRLDVDGDGVIDDNSAEGFSIQSGTLYKR